MGEKRGFLSRVRSVIRPRANVELITHVKRSPYQNWLHRKKVYNILQGSRIPFLGASAYAYLHLHNVVLSAILFVICVPLPWIAVVIANGQGEPADARTRNVYKPQAARQAAAAAQALSAAAATAAIEAGNPTTDTAAHSNHEGEVVDVTPDGEVVDVTADGVIKVTDASAEPEGSRSESAEQSSSEKLD